MSQPFLLKAMVEGQDRKHIPDYFLTTERGPVVVDVKPRRRLSKPVVAFTFAWTRQAVESRGWRHEVWCEPLQTELDNIRFLAGYRRSWLFSPDLLQEVRRADLDGLTLGEAARCVPARAEAQVRAAIHHLLWKHELRADLTSAAALHEAEDSGMSGAGTRIGVGTRFLYDGEAVEVVELAATTAGNEVVLEDGRGRIQRLSLKELLFSDRARVLPGGPGPSGAMPLQVIADREGTSLATVRLALRKNGVAMRFSRARPSPPGAPPSPDRTEQRPPLA